jgi:ABC-2 type transport system permease protein
MNKTLTIARNEFLAAVRSKAFIIGLLMLPLIMLVSVGIQEFARDHVDTQERKFAIIDHTGNLGPILSAAAQLRNDEVAGGPEKEATGGPFTPEIIALDQPLPELRLELSERIRGGDLFAFIEIPVDIVDLNGTTPRYHSEEPTYRDLPKWLIQTLTVLVRELRFEKVNIDAHTRAQFKRLDQPISLDRLGLLERDALTGDIAAARKVDKVRAFVIPIALSVLLYMIVLTTTPQMLNTVLEEKMGRISEVLLGSVSPFQLMLGKLLGCLWVTSILAGLYIGCALGVAHYHEMSNAVPLDLIAWFALYLLLAIFFYGSIFIAIGSACNDIKDAQAAMMPVMLVVIMPMLLLPVILKNPNGPLAVGMSLFPPATPTLMTLRIALQPGPPLWQPLLALVLTTATTIGCIWAAGKIFRTGILMQGKSATFREMLRWVFTK